LSLRPRIFILFCLFIHSHSLTAQIVSDPYQPFRGGETIGFPFIEQYLGDLPPDLQRFPQEREFHSLNELSGELVGWNISNTTTENSPKENLALPGMFFEDVPNPFGAAAYMRNLPGGWTTDWFNLPSQASWGPQASRGAIIIREPSLHESSMNSFSLGIGGNVSENGLLISQSSGYGLSVFSRQTNSTDDPSSFPSSGLLGKFGLSEDANWRISLSALTLQETQNLYWHVISPSFVWDDGEFLSASFKPFLSFSGNGETQVQETGGIFNGKFNAAGIGQSQWGGGIHFLNENNSAGIVSNPKGYIQNSEWLDGIGVVLAHGIFRVDFFDDQSSEFSWIGGLKYVLGDWSLFAEGAKSLQTLGDDTEWEAGISDRYNNQWRWDFEFLDRNMGEINFEGGRGNSELLFPISIKDFIKRVSVRISAEDLQDNLKNWTFDFGADLEVLFQDKSKVYLLFHSPQTGEWMLEGGIDWRLQHSLGIYAYLTHAEGAVESWLDLGSSPPTFGGLGLRGEF
jgi:hypothetical protein